MGGHSDVTEQDLINAGLEIARSAGLNNLTTADITSKTGISDSDFHSLFPELDDLISELLVRTKSMILAYTMNSYTDNPFYNFGLGLVFFARDEEVLFRSFFLENNSYRELIDRLLDKLMHEMSRMSRFEILSDAEKRELLMKVWCWSQGVANFVLLNYVPRDDESIKKFVYDTGHLIIQDTLERAAERQKNLTQQNPD